MNRPRRILRNGVSASFPPLFRARRKWAVILARTLLAGVILASSPRLTAGPDATPELASRLQSLFSDLADRVRPAVVSIGSTEVVQAPEVSGEVFQQLLHGQHRELRRNSLGSGVIVDTRGFILTNDHVVGAGGNLRVRLWNNQRLPAVVVQRDATLDIALIKIDHRDLVALPLGSSDKLLVGHWVIAVGNPFGLSHTVSVGIVSAVGRSDIGLLPYESFIQTDASIHQGNSGGPLVNLEGKVVGINTAIYSNSGGANLGIGFAIPINLARALTTRWMAGKKGAFLGVDSLAVDRDMASYYDLDEARGTFVARVEKNSPADRAGVRAKDILLSFNGVALRDVEHLRVLIAQSDTGIPVSLELLRAKHRLTLVARLVPAGRIAGTSPPKVHAAGETKKSRVGLGITVSTINDEIAARLGISPRPRGIVVLEVAHESPAAAKGIRVGDVIVEVNEIDARNIRQFRDALKRPGKGVMLKIERYGMDRGYVFLSR